MGIFYDEEMKNPSTEGLFITLETVWELMRLTYTVTLDYQADVDKTQVIEKFAGFHPSLLAIIKYVASKIGAGHPWLTSQSAKQLRSSDGHCCTVLRYRPGGKGRWS